MKKLNKHKPNKHKPNKGYTKYQAIQYFETNSNKNYDNIVYVPHIPLIITSTILDPSKKPRQYKTEDYKNPYILIPTSNKQLLYHNETPDMKNTINNEGNDDS